MAFESYAEAIAAAKEPFPALAEFMGAEALAQYMVSYHGVTPPGHHQSPDLATYTNRYYSPRAPMQSIALQTELRMARRALCPPGLSIVTHKAVTPPKDAPPELREAQIAWLEDMVANPPERNGLLYVPKGALQLIKTQHGLGHLVDRTVLGLYLTMDEETAEQRVRMFQSKPDSLEGVSPDAPRFLNTVLAHAYQPGKSHEVLAKVSLQLRQELP